MILICYFCLYTTILHQNKFQFCLFQKTILVQGVQVPYVILGDPAYPLKTWLMKNYPFTGGITKEQDSFNAYLNKGRVTVELAFGRLKGRWRRLTKRIESSVTFVPTIISTCCVLHNIVEYRKDHFVDSWLDIIENNQTEYPQPEPQQRDLITDYGVIVQEERAGEQTRNALLEVTKRMPVITSLTWRAKKF